MMTYSALNRVNLVTADIRNDDLQYPSSQRHFIECDPEFELENVRSLRYKARTILILFG